MKLALLATASFLAIAGVAHADDPYFNSIVGHGQEVTVQSVTQASIHGSAGAATGCATYAVDNGCTLSTTYITTPAFQDATLPQDYAQSGQLPTSASGGQIAVRNALVHSGGANIVCIDYKCGSAIPSGLPPASGYTPTGNAVGVCAQHSTGFAFGNGPYILCQGLLAGEAGLTVNLPPMDWTDGGTDCEGLEIKNLNIGSVTGISYDVTGGYWQGGPSCTIQGNAGGVVGFIYLESSGTGSVPPDFQCNNCTIDGNFANLPTTGASGSAHQSGTSLVFDSTPTGTVTTGQFVTGANIAQPEQISGGGGLSWTVTVSQTAADGAVAASNQPVFGRVNGVIDDRSGSTQPYLWTKEFNYTLFENLGANPVQGGTAGDTEFNYTAGINNCLSGIVLNHCDGFMEDVGAGLGTTRNVTRVGTLLALAAGQQDAPAISGLFYISSGNPGNNTFGISEEYNTVLTNLVGCNTTNSPPYSYNNPCLGGGINGASWMSLDYTTAVIFNNLFGNTIDATGSGEVCGTNGHNAYPSMLSTLSGSLLSITQSTPTLANPTSWAGGIYVLPIWPGSFFYDDTDGWGTTVASLGTYTNDGTLALGVATGTISNAGSGYTNGTYTNVPLTGGGNLSSLGAQATIVVSGGIVTSVTITASGHSYTAGTNLTAAASNLGGTGSGFLYNIATTTACVVGTNGGCGTVNIGASETASVNALYATFAAISFPNGQANNWSIGGTTYQTSARAITVPTSLPWTSYASGSFNCP